MLRRRRPACLTPWRRRATQLRVQAQLSQGLPGLPGKRQGLGVTRVGSLPLGKLRLLDGAQPSRLQTHRPVGGGLGDTALLRTLAIHV